MGERKYYLDWLRIFAFGMLIVFHVGMMYVTWGYNLKSPRIFPDLELAMNAVSPWRLTLLFFISGVASRFLLQKLSAGGFARDRLRRLLPVILLGMLVIIPPQVYVEFLDKGLWQGGYLDFWLGSYLLAEPYPGRILPTWDHLWFLVYLLFYAMGLAVVFALRGSAGGRQVPVVLLVIVPGLWLSLGNLLVHEVAPVTFALFDDWANHLRWLGVFVAGVVCASQAQFWEVLRQHRAKLALCSVGLLALYTLNQIYYRSGQADPAWDGVIYSLLRGIYGWSVVLTLSGYAAQYLNRSSRQLSYLTDAVLPIYVFHQPVMLVLAYVLFPLALPLLLEVVVLVGLTGVGSWLGYELFARRGRIPRFLFGLKARPAAGT